MSLDQDSAQNSVEAPVAPPVKKQPKPAQNSANPLNKFFRQPAIYVSLPSGGEFWPEGSLDMPVTGELPVYPLTSRDEIILRTPDALMNGQGVVDVIQSCIPNIKDAWAMPSVDTDAVLLAIRIASYGHAMDFDNKCPHCEEEHTYTMDLRQLSATIKLPDYQTPVCTHGLTVKFRPSNYAEITELNKANYEINRMNDGIRENADEDVQRAVMTKTLNTVIDIGNNVMTQSTLSITDDETGIEITEKEFINEFYKNIDNKLYTALQEALSSVASQGSIKPVDVNCQSCNGPIALNILFDYASFFVVGS